MNTKRKSKNTPKKSDPPPATASGTEELVIDLFLTDAILCLGGDASFDALAAWVALAVGGDACLAAFERRARRGRHAAADLDEDARREQGARYLLEERLRPLVTLKLCAVTGRGTQRTVRMEAPVAAASVVADVRDAVGAAGRLLARGRHTYDEVRLRAAAALRHTQDPLVRCLLLDTVLKMIDGLVRGQAEGPADDATTPCVQPGADGAFGVPVTPEQILRRSPRRTRSRGGVNGAPPGSARTTTRRGAPAAPPAADAAGGRKRQAGATPAGERGKDTRA